MKRINKEKILIIIGMILALCSLTLLLFNLNVFKTNNNDYDGEQIGTLASSKIKITFN